MSDRAEDSKEQVATDILSYLLRNPGAADSLDGFARWRLLEELVQRSVDTTQSALNWLIAQGYVTEVTRLGGEPIFLLNTQRLEDARAFVERMRNRKSPERE